MAYGQILGQSFETSPVLDNYFTKDETLTSNTSALYGFGTDAVPDDVLDRLTDALLVSGTSGAPKKPNGTSVTIPASSISGITNAAFVTGVFIGDGSSTRTINLGFKPSALIVSMGYNLYYSFGPRAGIAVSESPLIGNDSNKGYEITSSGFIAYTEGNVKTNEHKYIAFR